MSLLGRLRDLLSGGDGGAPEAPATQREVSPYPAFAARYDTEPTPARPQVFEPALKHLQRAFRRGEPVFPDEATAAAWRSSRRSAIDHVLRLVAGSSWREALVLRGGILLQSWLPRTARSSRDIDWVVTFGDNPDGKRLIGGLVRLITEERFTPDAVELFPEHHHVTEIWTYERFPGKRLLVPFQAPEQLPGEVQLDFVFGEPLPVPAVESEVAMAHGAPVMLRTVTRELALAWKLLWLASDSYPQGKDLYDAVLLAEEVALVPELLAEVLRTADSPKPLSRAVRDEWKTDWDNFLLEYPAVQGSHAEWVARLGRALGPALQRALDLEERR